MEKKFVVHEPAVIQSKRTRLMVLTGLLFGVALVLAIVENALPDLPIPLPGIKLGLSNIAVMYALFFLDKPRAFAIAVLKALFVLTTRGMVAGFLSLFGGVLSIAVMMVLMLIYREKISYLVLSIFGAVFHNIGQFVGVTIIYENITLWAYLPVLVVSGLIAGILTATLLKFIIPAFNKLV